MNLNLEHVNNLPVRTWSWLGVNDTSIQGVIPDILPYQKNPIISGSSFMNPSVGNKGLKIREVLSSAHSVNYDDILTATVKTGMGANAADFITKNRNGGISLMVPSGVRIEEPILIQYDLDINNPTVIDLNEIIVEADSEVTVVINYSSPENYPVSQENHSASKENHSASQENHSASQEKSPVFHGGLTYLYAGKNAIIHLIQIQLLNEEAIHLNDIGAIVDTDGKIDIVQAELGAGKAINGCWADLIGDNSEINVNTIYFGDKKRSIDINYVVNHIGKRSHSEMNINGALLDESSKIFRGTIDFNKGAIGAVGHEAEYNLLFSPKIKNITAPLILCGEESVEGKHAANSGKIDENKLFYMMSRGLDELSAKILMIEARFQPVIEKIPFADLQNQIIKHVKERLNHVESI